MPNSERRPGRLRWRSMRVKVVLLLVAVASASAYLLTPVDARQIQFPDGKRFAFTIVDDTDMSTLERAEPIYATLHKYGLRTTKTVWVYEPTETSHPANLGGSLHDPKYREFVNDLQRKGFEIALHGVRGGSSPRQDTVAGFEEFKRYVGQYPRMHVNHSRNRENIYWGPQRFSFTPYRWAGALLMSHKSFGHDPGSEFFWGDLSRERVQYVRQFTFTDINLLAINPSFPYRLQDKPYVNYWFPTAHGGNADAFAELLKPENLDKLEREGGVCLVYAHLAGGSFNRGGRVDPRFEERLKDLSSRNGWFAPASDILDHLAKQPGWTGEIGFKERLRLETRFIFGQLF